MLALSRMLGTVAVGCTLLLAAACSGAAGQPSAEPGQLRVVTAFYPLQFVAERVVGRHAAVANLTQPGVEPHDVELTPRQVAALSDADAVIYLRGFQPAVDEAVAQSGNRHVLDTSVVVPLRTTVEKHANDHAEDGHDRDELDPHVWLDPANMAAITEAVVAELSAIDPVHAADYRAGGTALRTDLDELDTAYESGLTTCDRREFITSHAAFGYLAERYDLLQIGISGLSPDAEPSPARIAHVQQQAKVHQITTIFYETLVSPAVATSIAQDLGLVTDVLDPIEAVTAESRGDNYIAVMRSNLAALEKANGCR